MMGLFHMLMIVMHIFSKRIVDAGLRDLLFRCGVIANGSVERSFLGKM